MTNPPGTVPKSAPPEPAGGERIDPQTWLTPLQKPNVAERDDPAPVWRSWLGEKTTESHDDTDPDSEGDTESPNPTASALVLDDDPMAPIVSEMYARRAARRHRLNRRVMIGAAVTAVAVAAAVGALVLAPAHSTDAAGVAPASTPSLATAAVATPVPPAWCHAVDSANLIVSDGAGGLSTGTGVILAQQFSLYVRRDVAGVRAVLAPDAQAASEAATRAAIDATPPGTKHCVAIRPDGPDRWAVQVSEQRPDGTTPQWAQTVTTATQADGRVLITSITAGGA
ncbi:hypothetical protein ACWIGW_44565 [Nocardia brasiliensis]